MLAHKSARRLTQDAARPTSSILTVARQTTSRRDDESALLTTYVPASHLMQHSTRESSLSSVSDLPYLEPECTQYDQCLQRTPVDVIEEAPASGACDDCRRRHKRCAHRSSRNARRFALSSRFTEGKRQNRGQSIKSEDVPHAKSASLIAFSQTPGPARLQSSSSIGAKNADGVTTTYRRKKYIPRPPNYTKNGKRRGRPPKIRTSFDLDRVSSHVDDDRKVMSDSPDEAEYKPRKRRAVDDYEFSQKFDEVILGKHIKSESDSDFEHTSSPTRTDTAQNDSKAATSGVTSSECPSSSRSKAGEFQQRRQRRCGPPRSTTDSCLSTEAKSLNNVRKTTEARPPLEPSSNLQDCLSPAKILCSISRQRDCQSSSDCTLMSPKATSLALSRQSSKSGRSTSSFGPCAKTYIGIMQPVLSSVLNTPTRIRQPGGSHGGVSFLPIRLGTAPAMKYSALRATHIERS